jgi:ABC-type nitrate/sulfonate/bicarbonate transport system substrate-binding protein
MRLTLIASTLVFFCIGSALGDLERISVSIQTAVFWALPFWISLQEGFFEELGLDVAYEVFSSGAPQITAGVEDKSWDVGGAGCVPNIIGGLQGIEMIAISNDASKISALVANAKGAANWPPPSMQGIPVAVTANSTVHYSVLKCLTVQYPNETNFEFLYQPQSVVVQSLTPNEEGDSDVDYGSLWPPDLYSFVDSVEGAEVICDGEQVGAMVPGGLMVREEFGVRLSGCSFACLLNFSHNLIIIVMIDAQNERPDMVARFLAGWIRGIGYMLNPEHRAKSEEYLAEFNENTLPGYVASPAFIEKDFTLREFYDLEEQLAIFDRSNGKSEVDYWYESVSVFLIENGVIADSPPIESYITDKYLQMVAANETLRDFTLRSSAGYVWPEDMAEGSEDLPSASQSWTPFSMVVAMSCWAALLLLS